MITILSPIIENNDNEIFLSSIIKDSVNNIEFKLWYSTSPKFGKYFCDEVADAFLIVVLQIAMKTHQDIKVNAPISSLLLYNIRTTIVPMLTHIIEGSSVIKIDANEVDFNWNANAIGCGCSLGVDSFSSLLQHWGDSVSVNNKLTHLAIFNVGDFGTENLIGAEDAFEKDINKLSKFAKELQIPLVAVNSNIHMIYSKYKCVFLQCHHQMRLSPIFALQKLFKKYFIASSHTMNEFKLSYEDVSYCESVLTPLLCTQSLSISLDDSMKTRVEKTIDISHDILVKKYLDVCWGNIISNSNLYNSNFNKDQVKINCGKCEKCLRTLLTLELLGIDLKEYSEIFDLKEYKKYRWKYIVKILVERKEDSYKQEIYDLMKEKKYHISFKCKVSSFLYKIGIYRLLQKICGLSVMSH